MTRWRAVGAGFAVELFAGLVAFLAPGIGHLFAGFVGGLVAGYLCRSTLKSGIWHGLLAGGIGGFLVAVPLGLIVGWVITGLGLTGIAGGVYASVGMTGFVLIAAFLLAVDSAIGGGVGVIVRRILRRNGVIDGRRVRTFERDGRVPFGRSPPREFDRPPREEVDEDDVARTSLRGEGDWMHPDDER